MSEKQQAIVVRRPRGQKPRREENAEAKFNALLHAACEIVGEYGYVDASISRITERAGVAQGTFYSYFESRQDLFDQLLPKLGTEMLAFIKERTRGVVDASERERKGFMAFFDFIVQNPDFLRILNEAEQLAPKGHEAHFQLVVAGYLANLQRDWARGEYPGYDERELEVIVYMLLSARSYLALRYAKDEDGTRPFPGWVTDTYMKFITNGLKAKP
ncbi:MAG TPA: TetR/AcrR family transcriptional regulator [Mesorhizobium sp.]